MPVGHFTIAQQSFQDGITVISRPQGISFLPPSKKVLSFHLAPPHPSLTAPPSPQGEGLPEGHFIRTEQFTQKIVGTGVPDGPRQNVGRRLAADVW